MKSMMPYGITGLERVKTKGAGWQEGPWFDIHHHHNNHQVLGHLARSVSTVTAALANVSSVSRLISFLVDCSGMILKGFGCVAFFAGFDIQHGKKETLFFSKIPSSPVASNRSPTHCLLWISFPGIKLSEA
jgi:hypothetical protein